MVATSGEQLSNDLPRIARHAAGNGVADLITLSGDDVRSHFEPQVTCEGALFSPSSGILDSHSYMLSLLADAEEGGTTVAFHSPVSNVWFDDDTTISNISTGGKNRQRVWVESSSSSEGEGMQILCDTAINCTGLNADQMLRNMFHQKGHCPSGIHMDIPPRQFFAKGNYYRLEGQKNPFRHLVYPVPEKGGLGIHATIDLGNHCRFGPDVEWISSSSSRVGDGKDYHFVDPDQIDLEVDPARSESFYEEVRKYWPGLKDGALQPDYCGIRPKLGHPDVGKGLIHADFWIHKLGRGGGFVHLAGIESPGLTASMAIADEVVELLSRDGAM